MSKKAVFCLATSREQADQIVDHLKTESFSNNDISALFADQGKTHDFAPEKNPKGREGAAARTDSSGAIGGALGWIAGIGALAMPGVGPFIAGGPIVAALSRVAAGGIADGLIGLGIPEVGAKRYAAKVKEGNILISVHTEDAGDIARAKDIFQQAKAQEICTTPEAATKDSSASERVSRPAKMAAA